MLHWTYIAWARFELRTLVVICTDWICSCKSNYHTIATIWSHCYKISQSGWPLIISISLDGTFAFLNHIFNYTLVSLWSVVFLHYIIFPHLFLVRNRIMAVNATFSNISVLSLRSVFLVEESEVSGETVGHWHTLSRHVVSSTPRFNGIWIKNFSGDMHWLHR